MPVSPTVLEQALTLLTGELRDSTGALLLPPTRTVSVGHTRLSALGSGDPRIRTALEARCSVVIPVAMAGGGAASRVAAVVLARWRVWCARRVLARSGATRVRVLALVGAGDALFLAYGLTEPCRSYVETHIVLEASRAPQVALAKSAIGAIAGVSIAAELLVAVGERS